MPDLSLPLLDRVQIAAPCPAHWHDMRGDDVTRHCELCRLNVHNLSAMTRDAAEAFIAEHTKETGGRVCVRLWRRADGTVITRDCPVGLARVRASLRAGFIRAAAACGFTALAAWASSLGESSRPLSSYEPIATLTRVARFPGITPPRAYAGKMAVMGEICLPPSPPPSAPITGVSK